MNTNLREIIDSPQPPASRMQQIHADRMTKAAAAPDDGLGDGGLGDMFAEKHQNTLAEDALHAEREKRRAAANEDVNLSDTNLFDQPEQTPQQPEAQPAAEEDETWRDSDGESDGEEEPAAMVPPENTAAGEEASPLSTQDKAVEEASREPWWITLSESEKAVYRRVPENRATLRAEGKKRTRRCSEETRSQNSSWSSTWRTQKTSLSYSMEKYVNPRGITVI